MLNKPRMSGFTLVEVMIALTIFAIGLPIFVEAAAFATRAQQRAEATMLAADLGQVVLGRLSVIDLGNADLVEVTPNNPNCYNVSGSCVSDHGRTIAELTRVFANWGPAGNNDSAFTVAMKDGFAAVWYEGYWYHVAWNVENDTPYAFMRTFTVHVAQWPFSDTFSSSWSRISSFNLVRMQAAL